MLTSMSRVRDSVSYFGFDFLCSGESHSFAGGFISRQSEDEETLLAQGGHKDLLCLYLDCRVCRADYRGEFA